MLHLQYATGTPTASDLNTLSTSLAGIWNTRFAPLVDAGTTLTLTDLQDLSGPTGAYGSSNVSHVGTSSGFALPNNVALVVSWKTTLHYRGGHPRTYLVGLVYSDLVDSRNWSGTKVTATTTAMNSFITDVGALTSTSTGGLSLVMVSYHSHKVLRPNGLPFLITAAAVHTRVDSMRRRLGKEVT